MKMLVAALCLAVTGLANAQHSVSLTDATMGVLACPLAMNADQGAACLFDRKRNFVTLFQMSTTISGTTKMEAAEKAARTEFARLAKEHMSGGPKEILVQYSSVYITDVATLGKSKFKFTADQRIMGYIPLVDLMDGMNRKAVDIEAIPLEGYLYVTHVPKDK